MTTLGIIGGSGLYQLEGLRDVREVSVDTPFGAPSDLLVTGRLGDASLVFLPRHGRGHRLTPSEVPYRANVFALKSLGVEWLISVSSVGSMREHVRPGDVVVPDQYVDRTRGRAETFFGEGIVAHVSMADPVCPHLAEHIAKEARASGITTHERGLYLAMEGPSFSTRGESLLYRSWGIDIIGMTAMPEAKLAREAELHYATVAFVTDYDCWRVSEKPVTVEALLGVLRQNTETAKQLLTRALPGVAKLAGGATCGCASALAVALTTDRAAMPRERIASLAPLVGKYLT